MNAICSPCAVSELPTLQGFEERARSAAADHDRQQTRLKTLTARLEREQLIVSPAAFAALRAEFEQQKLIAQAAEQASAAAAREEAAARDEYNRQQAEADRQQRIATIDAALTAADDEANLLVALLGSIPQKLAKVRWGKNNLLQERAKLTAIGVRQ